MNELAIGISIDIQRSDGRVHSAVVSAIQSNSVTVEWYENGEAKGKEIELEAVFQLNASLKMPNGCDAAPYTSSVAYPPPVSAIPLRQPPQQLHYGAAPAAAPLNYKSSPQLPHPYGAPQQVPAHTPPSTGRTAQAAPPAPPLSRIAVANRLSVPPSVPGGGDENISGDLGVGDEDEDGDSGDVAQAHAGIPRRVRPVNKSNVVKEIERIQKNREERRAAQQKIRELPEYDTNNPNYEFLMMIKKFQNTLEYVPMNNNEPLQNHRICVCVRKRPLNKKEFTRKEIDVITIPNNNVVYVHEPKLKVDLTKLLENQQFRFDYAFDEAVDNMTVYRYTARPLVESVFEGGMATCFAYGQTGSGKTYTFAGEYESKKGLQDCSNGIYALAAKDVFQLLNTKYKRENLYVEASFFEIYGGKVFDLLNKKQKLRVLEDGQQVVNVVGLKEELVESADDVKRLLQHGNLIRTSGQTSANQHSSRSHAVFQIKLKKRQTRKLHGKFSLIDLAGNERGADTSSADRATRMEGAEINKSLLCLKECIRALGRKGAHLPFRGSKLTQVLRDSFIGERSRTCMIAMISPGMSSCEHTLNTLRYADRVKELAPNAAPNNDGTPFSGMNDDIKGVMEDDEFACLRSTEDDLISDEYLTFQQTVAHIEKMEEEVCDEHQAILDNFEHWRKEHNRLATTSNEVGYDVEDFAARLDKLLDDELHSLMSLKDKVTAWRHEMQEEEAISNQLKSRKKM